MLKLTICNSAVFVACLVAVIAGASAELAVQESFRVKFVGVVIFCSVTMDAPAVGEEDGAFGKDVVPISVVLGQHMRNATWSHRPPAQGLQQGHELACGQDKTKALNPMSEEATG
jgi:hypothetical protein